MIRRLSLSHLPLRLRLTLWYLLTFALVLSLSGLLLYWQTQRSLLTEIDTALQMAAVQAQINVDADNDRLTFQNTDKLPAVSSRFSEDIAIFLLSDQGDVWDKLGSDEEIQAFPPTSGLHTFRHNGDDWRVYAEPITSQGQTTSGWLQVAQSLEPVTETLAMLRLQLLWGLPLALILAGVGGLFLASRALAPIHHITQTAQSISASDLSRRIAYAGPPDEIGQLAATFDSMLNRLQAAFARERRFTADAAHELRTPLAALKGRIEVTLSQPRQPVAYVETLEDMAQQVDRLARLSSDLLYIARLDQGQLQPDHETIGLEDLLAAVIEQVQPLADLKAITIASAVPPDVKIRGDIDMLIRLFLNLLDNAVKYSPPAGQVLFRVEQSQTAVTIALTDSGPGILAEHLPHLFERFYRVESARARGWQDNIRGGAGLGLAIAHEIATAHGGSLTVHSTADQGTTFTVHLPQNVRPTTST